MASYDVVVFQDFLSDGSVCYGAWCSSVLGTWGQGDTEAEALQDIIWSMEANLFDPLPGEIPGDALAEESAAAAEMGELLQELADEGIPYRIFPVVLEPALT